MNIPRIGKILVLASLLLGCTEEDKITRDVQYYLEHQEERAVKIAECQNNPGGKAATANCINAHQAERKAMFSGKEMPSIR